MFAALHTADSSATSIIKKTTRVDNSPRFPDENLLENMAIVSKLEEITFDKSYVDERPSHMKYMMESFTMAGAKLDTDELGHIRPLIDDASIDGI
ncbi:hypothetical protein F5Y12DRAFT_714220 [Xylaria sp. FL1777]|nr:hypothetical protein F5Y12DRAFT_714220 [Xylaria sp. FL1777]